MYTAYSHSGSAVLGGTMIKKIKITPVKMRLSLSAKKKKNLLFHNGKKEAL